MDAVAKAEALGTVLPKSKLHPRASDYLEHSSCRIGIACSGGADSVAALLLVYHHFPQMRDRMTVLHFNHQLRGLASEEDVSYVNALAEDLELPIECGAWSDRDSTRKVSEAEARKARHAFFDAFVTAQGNAIVVTGHQQQDILESMLLRIARASDLPGLIAPRPVSKFSNGKVMLRPLLCLNKKELLSGLAACQVEWKEDLSNQESQFDRNRLRNDIISAWQEATQFDLCDASSTVRGFLEDADEALEHFLGQASFPPVSNNPARLPKESQPRALVRRWLLRWLDHQGLGGICQRSMIEELASAFMTRENKQWSAGTGYIRLHQGEITFLETIESVSAYWEEFQICPGQTVALPEGRTLSCDWHDASPNLLTDLKNGKYSEKFSVLIDRDSINSSSLVVRPWLPGDRYKSLNGPGNRKLQDMFVDRKISKEERNRLPVVLSNDSVILWCPGLPVNHICRITQKTKEILQLTYT